MTEGRAVSQTFDVDDAFAGFDDDPGARVRPARPDAPKFPCSRCYGTGRYTGPRVHQAASHCFACKGKGWFTTPPGQREKQRAKRAESAAKRKAEAIGRYHGPSGGNGMLEFLGRAMAWSGFAADLHGRILGGRMLTEKQEAAVTRMMESQADREAKRKAEREAEAARPAQFAKLVAAFDAMAKGLKWPKLYLATDDGERVTISRAGSGARYPHSLNVTDGKPYGENQWFGRITTDGKAQLKKDTPQGVLDLLAELERDPQETVRVVGKRIGHCGVCGRELTNPESIANGIGPICAERF